MEERWPAGWSRTKPGKVVTEDGSVLDGHYENGHFVMVEVDEDEPPDPFGGLGPARLPVGDPDPTGGPAGHGLQAAGQRRSTTRATSRTTT